MEDIAKGVGYIVLILMAVALYSEYQDGTLFSEANCQILALEVVDGSYPVKGDLDYGYTVQTIVRNVGKDDLMSITAYLSTSEGSYKRSQTLFFAANQQVTLQYQFLEPTLNVTGVQARLACLPRENKKQ